MKKQIVFKACLLAAVICFALICLCSCSYRGYSSDYPGAYTLTYTQVPGTRGATRVWTFFRDPQIVLLETDSEGRGLYLYLESRGGPLSLVIVQRESENTVYFYPEESAISFRTPDRIYDNYDDELPEAELRSLCQELCSAEELASFKVANDWGEPIDESRLDSAKITRPKLDSPWSYRTGKVIPPYLEWRDLMLNLAVKNGHNVPEEFLNGNSGMNIYDSWMATDKYGRELHYVESQYYVYPEEGVSPYYYTCYYLQMVAIINPDGSFDPDSFMIELDDICAPSDQIRQLKRICGWNQPYDMEVAK